MSHSSTQAPRRFSKDPRPPAPRREPLARRAPSAGATSTRPSRSRDGGKDGAARRHPPLRRVDDSRPGYTRRRTADGFVYLNTRGLPIRDAREIARISGVDAALVGHHFGSKETLWAAVVEQIADEVAPMIERIRALHEMPELSPRQRVEQAMAFFIDQVFAMPDVGMFFSTAATEHGERLDFLVDRLVRPVHDVFLPLILRAMKAGEMPARDPEILFSMIANGVSKTVSYSHVLAAFSSLPARPAAFKREVLATAIAMLG
ncbi:TetR/AcrR family transcriptional regulator [Burkholderia gladioli]|uniref:TetR/AcrR family transcriptional regulator n=1 Tax=Burkholderia gladioli TaxID=28095 RepID=UPI003F78B4C6